MTQYQLADALHYWLKRVSLTGLTEAEYVKFKQDSNSVTKVLNELSPEPIVNPIPERESTQERVDVEPITSSRVSNIIPFRVKETEEGRPEGSEKC